MTTRSMDSTLPPQVRPQVGVGAVFALWRENVELLLAAITLLALLTGWIGGALTNALPQWSCRQ